MEIGLVFILLIGVAIMIRVMAGSFDGERIERYLHERGYELIDKSWEPLGPGWFGEKDSRIYEVTYRDEKGNIHRAHVKTSMLSGVYLSHDRIIQKAPISAASIQAEKEALKRRLAELDALDR
jgi:hypothetical protein